MCYFAILLFSILNNQCFVLPFGSSFFRLPIVVFTLVSVKYVLYSLEANVSAMDFLTNFYASKSMISGFGMFVGRVLDGFLFVTMHVHSYISDV